MEIEPSTLDQHELYKLIIGSVVPRPIAWVSTADCAGNRNLAPFSFFNGIGSNPPALSISVTHAPHREDGRKDTLQNILETEEFVVNIVTEATAAAMNDTATLFPHGVDEFVEAGVTPAPSKTVRPARIAESPISFECVLHTMVAVGEGPGSGTLVIGRIQHMHIRDDIIDERGYIDIRRLQPVGRLAGSGYCRVNDLFELVRKP